MRGEGVGGIARIGDKGVEITLPVRARGHHAGHQVHAGAGEGDGVGQRAIDIGARILLAARQRRQPPFAGGDIAGRGVEQHLLQAVFAQFFRQQLGGMLVREQELHRVEALFGSGGEALEERHFVKHHR